MNKLNKPMERLTYSEKEKWLLELNKITREDLKILNKKELNRFETKSNHLINSESNLTKEILLNKFAAFITKEQKNMIWEHNHHIITQEIHLFLEQYKMLPSKNHLMKVTNLSHSTIDKHLMEFASDINYKDYLNQMEFMAHKVLSKILTSALQGDISASRLFLETIGPFKRNQPITTFIKNQNNYLQFNNTILTEESLNKLPQEKLLQIEEWLKLNE